MKPASSARSLFRARAITSLRRTTTALVILGALGGRVPLAVAQTVPPVAPPDTLHKYETPTAVPAARAPWYRGKLVRATVVPAALIGYGVSTINSNGFYSSYDARADVRRAFPGFRTRLDDLLILAPYFELGAVALAGVESRDDRLNTVLVILKAEAIMGATVIGLKNWTKVRRPDGTTRDAFPSGHTAQAFLAASIVHTEFRDKSQWYGVGAYAIATSVAGLRMLNNRHWQSDVFVGAGIGILSAHVGYLTHRHRWGRKPRERRAADVGVSPRWLPGAGAGLAVTWQFRR